MARLRRSDCGGQGFLRRRAGRGFTYLDESGRRISDPEMLDRIKGLAIPPAWQEVWICPLPNGHIQATGTDDAGRKQYLYHEDWSRSRSALKFEAMLDFADQLPRLRRAVARDLDPGCPSRESALACGVRLIDLAHFRVGSEQYAAENDTYGVATLLRRHVRRGDRDDELVFEYPGKGSQDKVQTVRDADARALAEVLLRRRSGPDDFLVYRGRRAWVDITSDELNSYIQDRSDERFSAKDFRTWNGTVLAAISLAGADRAGSSRERERRIRHAIDEVAAELGNTAAVARDSYVDPRLLDRYRNGQAITVRGPGARRWAKTGLSAVERRVRDLLRS